MIKLTYNQRQFVYEQFNRAFGNYKIFDGKRLAQIYGPYTQTLLKEALHTYCFQYPLKPEEIKEEVTTSEKKKAEIHFYKFTVKIKLPIFGEEITLEEKILKVELEKR